MNNDTRNMHITLACTESAQSLSHFVHLVSHVTLAQVLSLVTCHPCSCAFLLESFLLFYFHLSFPVFFFSFHLLHCERYSELDNLIAMQNLRYSVNKGSEDVYDVSVSLTRSVRHPSKLHPRRGRIRGTIQVRLSFQIDGFLTDPSQL